MTITARVCRWSLAGVLLVLPALAGCQSWYYSAMEKFGYEKRDILVERVKAARETQQEAAEEFRSALERFKAVVEFDGGTLEEKYDKLNSELERSERRANEVHDRIEAVRDVSKDLFREWERELREYSDRSLRQASERELRATRARCDVLIKAMERAEERIEPVLQPLRDRVLFLKHNLNAQAIGALDSELVKVKASVDTLVADLERAIAEADRFLAEFEQQTT